MTKKKNYLRFLAWWVSVLLTGTGIFWAHYFGFIHKIWESDVTMITSLIAAVFVGTNLILGSLALRVSDSLFVIMNKKKILDKLDSLWFMSEQLMALGMLGTVIGLIHMLAANFIGTSGDADMQVLLGDMWKAMGLALYTNAVGLIASITLKIQVFMVGYGIDETT